MTWVVGWVGLPSTIHCSETNSTHSIIFSRAQCSRSQCSRSSQL
jgi:hypothetical protein